MRQKKLFLIRAPSHYKRCAQQEVVLTQVGILVHVKDGIGDSRTGGAADTPGQIGRHHLLKKVFEVL